MKPILFNTGMVQALLKSHKTVTRRLVKPQPEEDADGMWHWKDCQWMAGGTGFPTSGIEDYAPYHPGDILYVRETWAPVKLRTTRTAIPDGIQKVEYLYKADNMENGDDPITKWHPSIHMPKEAARIFLRVIDVRMERLRDISATSAMDEGFTDWNEFVRVWDSTIKPADRNRYGWAASPWVWVIKFERISKEEAMNNTKPKKIKRRAM